MRNVLSFNEGWTLSFPKHERESQKVNLPHTWNAIDGMDGNGSYLRTTGIYSRTFLAPSQPLENGRLYLEVSVKRKKMNCVLKSVTKIRHRCILHRQILLFMVACIAG